mgnify:CR=1 FL=1
MSVIDDIKQVPPHTLITGLAAIAWLASFGLRAVFPDFALGPAADTLMATCVAWWMKQNKAKNPDGLMNEVLEKVAMPYISTAHSPAPSVPKPVQPTPAPKPVPTTTTQPTGGLPWER